MASAADDAQQINAPILFILEAKEDMDRATRVYERIKGPVATVNVCFKRDG